MLLGLRQFASCDQQISDINASPIVFWLHFQGAREFLVGANPVLELEIGSGQLVMGVSEVRIHLNGIAELNCRFAVFSFVEKALPAFKVLLLADVGIA